MKQFSKIALAMTLAFCTVLAFVPEVSASGFTYWFNDGTYGTMAQMYYATDSGTYALPIFMDTGGRIIDLSEFNEVVYLPN